MGKKKIRKKLKAIKGSGGCSSPADGCPVIDALEMACEELYDAPCPHERHGFCRMVNGKQDCDNAYAECWYHYFLKSTMPKEYANMRAKMILQGRLRSV